MARERILLIEDEPDIAEVLQYNLEKEGFQVELARRGDTGLEAIRREPPDLIVLDLMLPGIDGLELTRLLKRDPRHLAPPASSCSPPAARRWTASSAWSSARTTTSPSRSARARWCCGSRRCCAAASPRRSAGTDLLEVGGIQLDISGHQLRVRGEEVPLTATEFRLLRLLLERGGRVQTRGQLLSDVWGYAEDIDSRTVDTHIRRLRRKLGPEADRIETVIGVGYRLRP